MAHTVTPATQRVTRPTLDRASVAEREFDSDPNLAAFELSAAKRARAGGRRSRGKVQNSADFGACSVCISIESGPFQFSDRASQVK
ncbi:MAG TPA: hypothetical protein VMF09_10295 [Solirubrobacteraceae bacterium]|nr:hypothetical protein [Solirubrobacteraceae bacterium]